MISGARMGRAFVPALHQAKASVFHKRSGFAQSALHYLQKLFQPCCDVIDLCDRIRHGEPNVRVLLMLVPRMTMRLLLFMLVLRVFTEDFNPFTRRDHGQGRVIAQSLSRGIPPSLLR